MSERGFRSPKSSRRVQAATLLVVMTVALVLGASGCAGSAADARFAGARAGAGSPNSSDAASRARRVYSKAFVLRPASANLAGKAAELAPLLVLEAIDDAVSLPACVDPEEPGADANRPSCIYYSISEWRHDGRLFEQATYLFTISKSDARRSGPWRGARITIGSDGFPVVWEVLSSDADEDVLFVSASFEAAARNEFGSPAPGRSFSSERPESQAPNSRVARVLDDGPVPMGPYLYVAADRAVLDGVLCRCMPAQFEESSGTHDYQLRPVESLDTAARGALKVLDASPNLAERLRWPKGL